MSATVPFDQIGRLPATGDNVAIAVRRLEAGTVVERSGTRFTLPIAVLEGHRLAIALIRREQPLLSWGLPFGFALRDILPGEYVCNEKILKVLHHRHVDFPFPAEPNFRDYYVPYRLDQSKFRAGRQVERYKTAGSFLGFSRPRRQGARTRNYIAGLGPPHPTGHLSAGALSRFHKPVQ